VSAILNKYLIKSSFPLNNVFINASVGQILAVVLCGSEM
jgi:hypothetical protein